MTTKIVVVPTGTANTASVAAAFRRLGADLKPAETPEEIRSADRLVLPGVGAFAAAMDRIDEQGWRRPLVDRIEAGRPTLAICLGMQLLCAKSEENPETSGLGVVSTNVTRFPGGVSVPQLGWNRVEPDPACPFLKPGWAYFANSYRVTTVSSGWSGARTTHGGSFLSAIERDGVLGCQFHPELSGAWGAELLGRWLDRTEGKS